MRPCSAPREPRSCLRCAVLRPQVPVDSRSEAYCSFDGRARQPLWPGDSVLIRMSPWPVPMVCSLDASHDWFLSVGAAAGGPCMVRLLCRVGLLMLLSLQRRLSMLNVVVAVLLWCWSPSWCCDRSHGTSRLGKRSMSVPLPWGVARPGTCRPIRSVPSVTPVHGM